MLIAALLLLLVNGVGLVVVGAIGGRDRWPAVIRLLAIVAGAAQFLLVLYVSVEALR